MFAKIASLNVFRFFLDNRNVPGLAAKSLILLMIPYAYLILSGLIFDYWLKWYFMTTFIFVSLVILALVALALLVWAIVRYVKRR